MAEPDDDPLELEVEKALADYMSKCDSGEEMNRDEFLAQHSDLGEKLGDLLSVADWIEQLAGPRIEDLAQTPDPSRGDDLSAELDDTLPPMHSFATLVDESAERDLSRRNATSHGFIDDTTGPRSPAVSLSQPALPCTFGDYILERVLGRGGMGVVYYGRQVKLDRPVAVKMIRSGALASTEEVTRFHTEARSAAKLDHPNIVTVYQCDQHDGHHFFSMDYVDGMDLSKMIKEKPLELHAAARYVRDAARAIEYAHDQGIVHRDLKPANLLVDDHDNVRITDFGLAKSIDGDSGLTATGAAIGTPSYMSPEQAAGQVEEQQHSTDIYSLGAILFATVTGKPPFRAATVVQTIMQVIHRPPPGAASLNPATAGDLETIIDVCLQKSPDHRYPSAGELADDIDRYLAGAPIVARPVSPSRRAWYWLLGVPIFGAVLDHRVVEPTDAHRWVQRGLISICLLLATAWSLLLIPNSVWYKNRMPSQVAIASGIEGGDYHEIAGVIRTLLTENDVCGATVVTSAGSTENLDKLRRREVDLAMLQTDAVESSEIAVVAPLYYEAVHVIVRRESAVDNLQQLKGLRVRVGSQKAGSHNIARVLLEHAGLSFDDVLIDESPLDLESPKANSIDAAIIVARLGSPFVHSLLQTNEYRLLRLSDAWEFSLAMPSFHPIIIKPEHYPESDLGHSGVPSVATTAFLAARKDASAALILATLTHLYTPEVVELTGILSAHKVALWSEKGWHSTSREFFAPYRASSPAVGAISQ